AVPSAASLRRLVCACAPGDVAVATFAPRAAAAAVASVRSVPSIHRGEGLTAPRAERGPDDRLRGRSGPTIVGLVRAAPSAATFYDAVGNVAATPARAAPSRLRAAQRSTRGRSGVPGLRALTPGRLPLP